MANMDSATDHIEHLAHVGVELLLRSKLQVFRRGSADSTITGSPLLLISVTSAIGRPSSDNNKGILEPS
jgi:hypothetical protein